MDKQSALSELSQEEVKLLIKSTNGGFFGLRFIKRSDGKMRTMLCRTGVYRFRKGAAGKGLPYDPKEKNLVTVWDKHAYAVNGDSGYRQIPVENVKSITFNGVSRLFT